MTTIPSSTFDHGALRRAFADRDASALLALYAEDATIEIADHVNTPSRPRRFAGRDAIAAHCADLFAREGMTHEVDLAAVGDDTVGYSVRCRYPDGTRVLCASTAALRDGRIVREVAVQAWDA